MESLWRSTCPMPAFPPLRGPLAAEAAVVGGGLCGLLTAFALQEAGLETVVLEAERILSGASEGTTAKITAQHGLIYDRLLSQRGEAFARGYAQAQQHALARYAALVRTLDIACQFERKPAFLYATAPSPALERECAACERLGLPVSLTGAAALPFEAAQALRMEDQAQFHPLRFGKALARRLTVYEHTRVTGVHAGLLRTERGEVRARHIVLCTHFPIRNVPGLYFARMHQARSYVLALDGAPDVGGMWRDASDGGYSLRNAGGLLLLGGAGHRTGRHPVSSSFRLLRDAARTWYPDARETARWSAQDCMTPDGVPYIGRYAESTPDWYVATGYNKWGMSSSMVAACRISDWIAGDAPYAPGIFDPRRFNADTAVEVLQTGGQALKGLGLQYLTVPETQVGELPEGHGGVVSTETEEKVGVYREPGGCLHAVGTRCPHMGCQVAWNPDEKSWECPCHGSRFDLDGHVIDNPAQEDLPQARVTPCADGKAGLDAP